jgi:hypothetical protein
VTSKAILLDRRESPLFGLPPPFLGSEAKSTKRAALLFNLSVASAKSKAVNSQHGRSSADYLGYPPPLVRRHQPLWLLTALPEPCRLLPVDAHSLWIDYNSVLLVGTGDRYLFPFDIR